MASNFTEICVQENIFHIFVVTIPEPYQNGTIPAIDGLEHHSGWLQMPKSYNESTFFISGVHFVTHLAIGGYRGDMSLDTAPYE